MPMASREDEHEYDDDYDNSDCWNCGGEGFVSNCFQEFACMYPDEGCDDCTRRCDVCTPAPTTSKASNLTNADIECLRTVLAEALAAAALTEQQ